jgi:aspartate racemase
MTAQSRANVLGIVGGMGPWASAEFLRTIYEHNLGEREQDAPSVIMFSDPTFPDRTEAFLAGDSDPLLEKLSKVLGHLLEAGATDVVLCCMTIHYLLPRLSPHLRRPVISLLDIIFAHVIRSRERYLLVCSTGTQQLRLFQNHEQWPLAKSYIILPEEEDQNRIHRELIYPIKKNPDLDTLLPLLESMLDRYQVGSFIAGCSEVHLLARHFLRSRPHHPPVNCIDPFAVLAAHWATLGDSQREARTLAEPWTVEAEV